MSRLVGTAVAGRFLGVTPRSVVRYIDSGLIPPAAHDRQGARGPYRIDLEQLHGLRLWLAQELKGADPRVCRCPTCGYGFIEKSRTDRTA